MENFLGVFGKWAGGDEKAMRKHCEVLCNAMPGQPRLKTIAAVGAYDAVIGGEGVDSRRLTAAMSYLLKSGFLIDPDFTIDVVNFRQKRDFLQEDNEADFVFVSFIIKDGITDQGHLYEDVIAQDRMSYEPTEFHIRNLLGLTLSRAHNRESWRRRIESSKAKIVVTFGGCDEIGTDTVSGKNVESGGVMPVIKTPAQRVADYRCEDAHFLVLRRTSQPKASLSTLYNGVANDLPMPWLGFAAASGYLKEIIPVLSYSTALGCKARAMAFMLG